MDHSKKLDFLHKIAKLGVQHFDGGGLVGGLGSALGISNGFTPQGAPTQAQIQSSLNQSNQAIQGTQNLSNITLPGATTGTTSQNALAQQLMAMTQGAGPNPAQNQLAQATAANTANQAALMAGQRGSSQNVGLLARQAAMQGAANQQGAAGQAATLGAQQQIAAQNNLANLASQQVGQAGQAAGLFSTAAGNQLNTLENANAAYNTTGATIGAQNASTNQGLLGGITGALGGLFAEGGEAKKMADGGLTAPAIQAPASQGSWVGSYLSGGPMTGYQDSGSGKDDSFSEGMKSGKDASTGLKSLVSGMMGPTSGSVGELGASDLPDVAGIGMMAAAEGGPIHDMANKGDVVKAKGSQKAVKAGNSYANDKVPAMLSEGEVVIDRDTLNDQGPMGQMARAIRSHIETRNKGKKK